MNFYITFEVLKFDIFHGVSQSRGTAILTTGTPSNYLAPMISAKHLYCTYDN